MPTDPSGKFAQDVLNVAPLGRFMQWLNGIHLPTWAQPQQQTGHVDPTAVQGANESFRQQWERDHPGSFADLAYLDKKPATAKPAAKVAPKAPPVFALRK